MILHRPAASKKNIFWIASFLIVAILAIQVLAFTSVTQYNPSDLGLLTKLPITFWIGLSYLVLLLYLGRKSGLRTLVVATLIFFFLFGIPVLVRENKAEYLALSYGFSSQGPQLLHSGRLQFGALDVLSNFNWPGFFIFSGVLSGYTGLPVTLFADYFPLLTMSLLGIIAYRTLRLQLDMLSSSFGTLWFIASFWVTQYYFAPQGIAYLLYFAIFLLLAKLFLSKKQNVVLSLSVLVLFAALVSTHLLTAFAVTCGVVAVYVLSKVFPQNRKMAAFYSITTCILLLSIFLAYQALVITHSFSGIIELIYRQLSQGETQLSVISQGRAYISPALQLQLYGSYGITIINGIIAAIAFLITALGILLHRREGRGDLFWIAWIILAVLIGVTIFYGGEVIQRAFILMLLPTSYFAAKFFSKKPRVMVLVLIAIVFLQIPAHYSWENWVYVPTSEIKGTGFYQTHAPSNAWFLYESDIGSFDAGFNGVLRSIALVTPRGSIPDFKVINNIAGQAEFIISSNEMKNFYQFFYGVNLLENLSLIEKYNILYDNEAFQIYARQS